MGKISQPIKGAIYSAAVVLILTILMASRKTASSPFPVWFASGLTRVGQTETPGETASLTLAGARCETVDAQVIVQAPASGLSNVNVSASGLTGPGGATISSSAITLYREHYVKVTGTANYGGGSNPPLGSGTYPEPLIPFDDPETGTPLCGTSAVLKACNASVAPGQNQPYWIDISVPRGAANTPPGTYTGNISITSTQGSVTVSLALNVWNFELPVKPSESSLWTLWPPASGNTVATLAKALMRNKVMSWYDEAANAASDAYNFGLNRSGLDGYYRVATRCDGTHPNFPSTSQIDAAAANFPLDLELDFYVGDELNDCPKAYPAVATLSGNAHLAGRGVKTIMTVESPRPDLVSEATKRSAIDHWVLLVSVQKEHSLPFVSDRNLWSPSGRSDLWARSRSDLWTYASCNTGLGNTPEWMVDYPPINERIQAGFLNWTQGAKGILYYRSDGWTQGNTLGSWNNLDTTACGGGYGRPGDGIFVYPPSPIASRESAPGIRLKAIRDGIQDHEYAQMLQSVGQVEFLDSVLLPIAHRWDDWTHDPNAIEDARRKLGQRLHQLSTR